LMPRKRTHFGTFSWTGMPVGYAFDAFGGRKTYGQADDPLHADRHNFYTVEKSR
jgi:hypothetical protein